MIVVVVVVAVKGSNRRKAESLLSEMKSRGAKPADVSYNNFISACGMGGEWQLALNLFDEMRKSSLTVSLYMYVVPLCPEI